MDDVKLQPYWWDDVPRPSLPSDVPPSVDVAVVGSGYAGLSTALTLARAGCHVVVFEAGDPGRGASTRNGGGFGSTIKTSFTSLVDRVGAQRAVAFVQEGRQAVEYIPELLRREGFDCDLALNGRFTGAHTAQDYETMARDVALQQKHMDVEAEMVPRGEQHREIGTDHYHGGRVLGMNGTVHAARLHQGLLEAALAAGAKIVGSCPVTGIERSDDRFKVHADRHVVAARDVVVATNGYTGSLSPWLRRRVIPIQSQIIVTEPIAPEVMQALMPNRRMYGDTCRLHHYYRPTPDGTRLLFGGRAGANRSDPKASGGHLYRRMTALFPQIAEIRITHSWTGNTAYTFDSLPHIGVHDGIHYVAGFCGSGTALAAYLGHKTALRLLQSPEAATVFDFDRNPFPTRPLYYGWPWFLPPVIFYYGCLDRMRL